MRRSTHIVFGGGVSGIVASILGCDVACIGLSIIMGSLVNIAIDMLSHGTREGRVFRGRFLHSLEGASAFSLLVAAFTVFMLPLGNPYIYMTALLLSGASHILLDSLTPGGVYVAGYKVRLSWARYDDPAFNLFFQAVGVVLIIASLLA